MLGKAGVLFLRYGGVRDRRLHTREKDDDRDIAYQDRAGEGSVWRR